jgi:hypothetical protein
MQIASSLGDRKRVMRSRSQVLSVVRGSHVLSLTRFVHLCSHQELEESFVGGDMSYVKRFFSEHPRLAAWFVLAIGMVAILVWSARDVGLLPRQWAALIVATIGLAGLCVWIIGWEEGNDEDEDGEDTE